MAGRSKPPGSESAEVGVGRPDDAATGASAGVDDGQGAASASTERDSAETAPEADAPEAGVAGDPAPEAAAEIPQEEVAATAPQDPAEPLYATADRPSPPPPSRHRGGFLALLLGGALAAAIGFAAARYVLPAGWPIRLERAEPPEAAAARAELQSRVSELETALDTRLTEMEEALAQPAADDPDMAQIGSAIDDRLDAATAPLAATLERLEERVAALESRAAAGADGGAALSEDDVARLDALRGALEGRRSELEDLQARLEETAQAAEARVEDAAARLDDLSATADGLQRSMALTRLQVDMAAGLPFETALQGLRGAGADVPEVLARHAAEGVASLDALRRRFPAAARDGLAAALQAQGGEDWGTRAVGYLRAQVGARSLAPREGDDPDAVLSRAEAALAEADLDGALAELEVLGEAGRAAMAGWISDAEAHLAVAAALDSLAAGN